MGVWVLAGVLLGAVCGFAATAARTAARDAPVLAALVRGEPSVHARLTVDGDPRPLSGRSLLVPATLTEVQEAGGGRLLVDVRILVFASDPAWAALLPSQEVWASGRLGPPRGGDLTAAVLSVPGPPERSGDPQWTQTAAGALRVGLPGATASLPAEPGGPAAGAVHR